MVCNERKEMVSRVTPRGLPREKIWSSSLAPRSGSPNHTAVWLSTGRPRASTGTLGESGARRRLRFHFNSSGASGINSRQTRRTPKMSSPVQRPLPMSTEVNGCKFNSNSVTTPKLPPPPRSAQNSSEFSVALARTREPSAVTSVKPATLSQESPNNLVSQPVPPPKISPEAPVCDTTPAGNTRPAAWVAVSIEPSRQPPGGARPPRACVNGDRSQAGEIDHGTALARAESRQAMPPATHRRKHTSTASRAHGSLYVANIRAAHDQAQDSARPSRSKWCEPPGRRDRPGE